jgi:hypothetical protein
MNERHGCIISPTWTHSCENQRDAAALPLGKEGVRILDVGTGPAPTPYAISDFYELLRDYGMTVGSGELAQQTTHFTIIERSAEMCRFMHHFSEFTGRSGPFGSDQSDFSLVDPAAERGDSGGTYSTRSTMIMKPMSISWSTCQRRPITLHSDMRGIA